MPFGALWPITLLAILVLMHFAKGVLVPLLLAALLAELLAPLVRRFERHLSTFFAVFLSLLVAFAVLGWLVYLTGNQLASLQQALPQVETRAQGLLHSSQLLLQDHFGLTHTKALNLFNKGLESSLSTGGELIVSIMGFTFSTLADIGLIVILAFLMLYFRRHLLRQLRAFAELRRWSTFNEVIGSIADVGQKYVVGLVTVIALVGALDTAGMFLVRAPFPVLFGLMGGLAVLIPFVGIIVVAPVMTIFAYAATGSFGAAGLVLAVYTVVHFLEGNVITPVLVGSKVDLNPLVSFLAVVVGGEIWGVAGMLLFIPLCGIVKLTLDAMPGWVPMARLLGPVQEEDLAPTWRRRRILRLKAQGVDVHPGWSARFASVRHWLFRRDRSAKPPVKAPT